MAPPSGAWNQSVEQRVVPLARVGCYVPAGRYPLPSSLLMTAIPARAAACRRSGRLLPAPDADGLCCRARGRRRPAVPDRRRACDRGDGVRHPDGAARGQDRRARQSLGIGRQVAGVVGLRDRFLCRADGDSHRDGKGPARWIAADLHRPGRTRPRRARRADHDQRQAREAGRGGSRPPDAGRRPGPPIAGATWRHHRLPVHARSHRPHQSRRGRTRGGGNRIHCRGRS